MNRIPTTRLLRRPFEAFFQLESASGILLLFAAVAALVWANSPWSSAYFHLWEKHLAIGPGPLALDKSLHHWINDGLMTVFFLLVGLEIKREVLVGELASPRRAALGVAAALGGMLFPAMIYALLNTGGAAAAGWGIPMATDIAFALGILALLGSRVPLSLKVFVTAIAIVDDLGAVIVIAIFYTPALSWTALAVAGGILASLVLLNALGVRRLTPYALLGFALWLAVLESGVHATIAGVALALTIPADRSRLLSKADGNPVEPVETPLTHLEHALHPWVAFLIMPLFALANAGVVLRGDSAAMLTMPITLGVILGLFVGKPIGIFAFSWIAVRVGVAALPTELSWKDVSGVGLLCGIGFTMSLFIANLAFVDAQLIDYAKVGILGGSLLSGVAGAAVLARVARTRTLS